MNPTLVDLPTGRLSVTVTGAPSWPLAELCGFAARNNTRRGFLFVSKVLGKHWPSRPAAMAQLHGFLAAQLPAADDLLFVGMAETATGLGHGLFEAYLARGVGDAVYLQTTRYPLDGADVLRFEERHSHARDINLHLPERADLRARALAAETVVLVDDEASTGQTLAALVGALRRANARLRRVVLAVLTDFSGGEAARCLAAVPGIEDVAVACALRGSYAFEGRSGAELAVRTPAQAPVGCRRSHVSEYSARLGVDCALHLPEDLVGQCRSLCGRGPVLVVGTGEFMHAAFCLGRELAAAGHDVRVQSTTRSPILVGADVRDALTVPDPYGEGIANYLYNFRDVDYAQVFVVHETGANPLARALCTALGAVEVDLRERVVRPAMPALLATGT